MVGRPDARGRDLQAAHDERGAGGRRRCYSHHLRRARQLLRSRRAGRRSLREERADFQRLGFRVLMIVVGPYVEEELRLPRDAFDKIHVDPQLRHGRDASTLEQLNDRVRAPANDLADWHRPRCPSSRAPVAPVILPRTRASARVRRARGFNNAPPRGSPELAERLPRGRQVDFGNDEAHLHRQVPRSRRPARRRRDSALKEGAGLFARNIRS